MHTTKSKPSIRAQERLSSLRAAVKSDQVIELFWDSELLDGMDRGYLLADAGAGNVSQEFRIAVLKEHHGSAAKMLQKRRGFGEIRAILDVARHTDLLTNAQYRRLSQEFGESLADPERAREDAIFHGDLVLTQTPKSVYWQGEPIDGDWNGSHGEAWEFLLTACEYALKNQVIERDSFGEDAREGVVKDKKYKLKIVPGFPQELISQFEIAGKGAQRFSLPTEQIHIFDHE